MPRLKYSVLRYSPSPPSGEQINLGILFHDEESDYREFKFTQNFTRLAQFDDELDIDIVQKLLMGIKDEFESKETSKTIDIESYTRFYINAFHFGGVQSTSYDDVDETIEQICKIYFRFDYIKSIRPEQ